MAIEKKLTPREAADKLRSYLTGESVGWTAGFDVTIGVGDSIIYVYLHSKVRASVVPKVWEGFAVIVRNVGRLRTTVSRRRA